MDASTKTTIMNMEEIKPKPVDQRVRRVRQAKLKAVMVLLFVVTLILECANSTLTTKCETQSDVKLNLMLHLHLLLQIYP